MQRRFTYLIGLDLNYFHFLLRVQYLKSIVKVGKRITHKQTLTKYQG